MIREVLIVHAPGEESCAELLAEPIRNAGYQVVHRGTIMIGESFTEEASKVMHSGGPVVLCGTVRALGTGWAFLIVNAARQYNNTRIFAVQMEKEAYLKSLSSDSTIAHYWQDPSKACEELITALAKYYPIASNSSYRVHHQEAERRYRELALESCDIIDLANLPESDRHLATRHFELRRLYVALRVRVEIPSDKIVGESNLKDIENRREVSRKLSTWDTVKNDHSDTQSARVPVGHRLSEAQRLVVLGDPGSGKTTLVRWIATSYLLRLNQNQEWKDLPDVSTLPDKDWLPVIVRCRDLDQTSVQGPLDQILTHTFRRTELSSSEAEALLSVLKEKLFQGEALLLIDGLDEIVDPVLRIRFCQQLEQIHVAYPNTPIIVTSRIVGYRELGYRIGRGFEHLTFVDLSKEDKADFARRWCALTETPERRAEMAEELIHDIHSTDRIERLTANPMLLTTLALVKRKIGSLPSRRSDLYWDALEVLLNWRREVDEPIDHREALPQLEYIAYAMCERGVSQLRGDEIIELLEQMREEYPQIHPTRKHSAEEFIRLLERQTGILIEAGHVRHQGRPTPLFEFRHLTFQEYLAGLALVDGRFPNRDRSKSLAQNIAHLAGQTSVAKSSTEDDDKKADSEDAEITVAENWREAIRLCVASCNDDDVDAAVLSILSPLEGEDIRTGGSRAVIAALCLADDPNASQDVVHAVLEELVKHVNKKDGTGAIKTSVDAAIRELAGSRWANALYDRLLAKYLERDSELGNAFGTLCAMVAIDSAPEGEAAIQQWFKERPNEISSDDENVAIGAALQVMFLSFYRKAYYHVPQLVIGLFKLLHRSPAAAFAAAWALYWINQNKEDGRPWQPTASELESIVHYLKTPTDLRAARQLIYILSRERAENTVEALIAKLEDSDEKLRVAVCDCLGWIGDRKAVDSLIARFSDTTKVQEASILSLGQLGGEQALSVLIGKLEDADPTLRESAAWALGWIADVRSVDPLVGTLDDNEIKVRQAVIKALGRSGVSHVVPLIISRLVSEHDDERAMAAWALGRFGDVTAIEPLIQALKDKSSAVRAAAVSALGRFRDIQHTSVLMSCLEDGDSNVQSTAALALGWVRDSKAVDRLIAKLPTGADVSKAAIQSLGKIGDARAVAPLITMLDDGDLNVQGLAIDALMKIGEDKANTPLIAKLKDDNPNIRKGAACALGTLGDVETVKRLCGKIEDGSNDEKKLAREALAGFAINRFESGDVEEAVEIFKLTNSISIEGDYGDHFHNNAAYCLMLLKRYEEAAEQFEAMEFSKTDSEWALYRHNFGVLSFLIGDVDKGRQYLEDSLDWLRVNTNYDYRAVSYMLVLDRGRQISSHKEIPLDAGILINLSVMGALSQERLCHELARRYRVEYQKWIVQVGLEDPCFAFGSVI
ncbi:MAG TPA: HEAT repeat domain-containing protein [Pyrinomonadaceae bacterium]|nr:HEAT repeat domain-containing protein [Pyrinomonadaceae bacterium]